MSNTENQLLQLFQISKNCRSTTMRGDAIYEWLSRLELETMKTSYEFWSLLTRSKARRLAIQDAEDEIYVAESQAAPCDGFESLRQADGRVISNSTHSG